MTHGQYIVLVRAFAYLIKQTPAPKSDKGKQDRQALLQSLINASRQRGADPAAADEGFGPAPRGGAAQESKSSSGTQPDQAPQSTALRVDIVAPQQAGMPEVREGSVAGTPMGGLAPEFRESR